MKKILLILFFLPLYTVAQIITTVAGTGTDGYTGDGGPATNAKIGVVWATIIDGNRNLFISNSVIDTSMKFSVIRKVDPSGIISTFAGTNTIGFGGDGGPATAAKLGIVLGLAFDRKGNVYLNDDDGNNRIRKVDTAGIITTYAGNGTLTHTGDGGPATAAGLAGGGSSCGMCIDTSGNLYFGERFCIRKVDASGIITTFAGTGVSGFSGDGGPATSAQFSACGQIAIDRHGNLYIADNYRIRKINTSGIITTVAGNGTIATLGDGGPATAAGMASAGVFPDDCDNLYIADGGNNRIRIVNGSGYIETIAGNGTGGYAGDGGPATSAEFFLPHTVYLDSQGGIYISDEANFRVRYININGCKNTTGIETSVPLQGELEIYPNPATTSVTITTSGKITTVSINNLLGQVIFSHQYNSDRVELDVADLPAGLYFVNINGAQVQKLVKE